MEKHAKEIAKELKMIRKELQYQNGRLPQKKIETRSTEIEDEG